MKNILFLFFSFIFLFTSCRPPELEGAYVDFNASRFDSALEKAQKATQLYPKNPEAWYMLGRLYGKKDDFKGMIDAFDKSSSISNDFTKKIKKDKSYYFSNIFKKAVTNYNRFIKENNRDSYQAKKLINSAILHFKNAYIIKKDAKIKRLLASCYQLLGKENIAKQQYESIIKENPSDIEAMLKLGQQYFKDKNYLEAISLFKRVLNEDSKNIEAITFLCQSYDFLKDTDNAIYWYEKAKHLNSGEKAFPYNLGLIYYRLANKDGIDKKTKAAYLKRVAENFDLAINIDPELKIGWEMKSFALIQLKRNDEAIETIKSALEHFPEEGSFWFNLGVAYTYSGKAKMGKSAFKKAEYLGYGTNNSLVSRDNKLNNTNSSLKKTRPKLPPDIKVQNISFFEPSRNNALDASEAGKIIIDLVNKGRGEAINLNVKAIPLLSSRNIKYKKNISISKISPGQSITINIPVSANLYVKSKKRKFKLTFSESNGFAPDPAIISFETLAYVPPDLQIKNIVLDDQKDAQGEGNSYGNGNGIIEPGESIEITAFVQNIGSGLAKKVRAEILFTSNDKNIVYGNESKSFYLGSIKSGDYKSFKFYFYTTPRYRSTNIPIKVKLTESTGMFSKTVTLGLKLGKLNQNVLTFNVKKNNIINKRSAIKKIKGSFIKKSDVDLNIPISKYNGKNTLAVIIGIEFYKYSEVPKVNYATSDAESFYNYCKTLLNIPERQIRKLANDEATMGEFLKVFSEDGWLDRRLKGKIKNLIIYYSGHGAPDIKSNEGFLIPYDIDPNYAKTGFALKKLYSNLSKMNAASVTLFIDACFSGLSRSQEMLIANARPVAISIKNPIIKNETFSVFTASQDDEYSTAYQEKHHGLFTYFLLKGLKGLAKGNDNKLTYSELFEYIKTNVSNTAGFLDKEQTPTFYGQNKIFINY